MRKLPISDCELRIFNSRYIKLSFFLLFVLGFSFFAEAKKEWPGMDQAVIEKYAAEQGRPPVKPLVKIEGDALLFTFILAGAIGGFILGYNWHKLFKSKERG